MARKTARIGPRDSGLATRYEEARQKGKGIEPGAKAGQFDRPKPIPAIRNLTKEREEFKGQNLIKGKIKERQGQVRGARILKREMEKK